MTKLKIMFIQTHLLLHRAYAEMLQCVYRSSYHCPDTLRGLIGYFVDYAKMSAIEMECKTEVKSPCEEEKDCVCILKANKKATFNI